MATNSPDPELLRPEQVKEGAIVCCASVPSNLSPDFARDRERHFAFNGGLARLPGDCTQEFVGMPEDGLVYACQGETFLLGFEGCNHSFCKGLLTPAHVYQAVEMANRSGFSLGEYQFVEDKNNAQL